MNLLDVNWQQVLAAASLLALLWAGGLYLVRANLAGRFVSVADSQQFVTAERFGEAFTRYAEPLIKRIDKVEQAQLGAPMKSEVQEIERRVERVENQVTEVQRTVTSVQVGVGELKAGVHGIERKIDGLGNQVDLVVKHLLGKEGS